MVNEVKEAATREIDVAAEKSLFEEDLLLSDPIAVWGLLRDYWNLAYQNSTKDLGKHIYSYPASMNILEQMYIVEKETAPIIQQVRALAENNIFPTANAEFVRVVETYRDKSRQDMKSFLPYVKYSSDKFIEDSDLFLKAVFNKDVFAGEYQERYKLPMESLLELTGGIPQVPVEQAS